jgi:acetylornithine deacetylase/succinyl-diaminopimelate desuccinylase-like protein
MVRALIVLSVGLATAPARAEGPDFDAAAHSARKVLDRLVAADTSNPPGNEARAVAIGVERLREANVPFSVSEFAPGRENLVARLESDDSAAPLLLLAHIDVVGADGQDWKTNPHEVVERDGFLYGRGVNDDLSMAAVALEVLLLLKAQRIPLARDVILAWTGDEESGGSGVRWLLDHEPDSIRAEIVLNEGGGVKLGQNGEPEMVELQTAEKTYQDFVLTARGPTGHSSVPLADNAIYRLARALERLAEHSFPPRVLPVTRANLAGRAAREQGDLGNAMAALADAKGTLPKDALAVADKNPALAASLRTTCVATQLSGGTRANALPAEARATLNCRILPDETAQAVEKELRRVIDDAKIEIKPTDELGHGKPSPLEGPAPAAIKKITQQMWPGLPIVPFMSRGATDSRFLRARGMVAYGFSPIALSEEDERRAHGIDERIPAGSLRPAVELLYRVAVELAAKKSPT